MHPFYDASRLYLASGDTQWIGLVSMSLYLIFWAVVCLIAFRLVRNHLPDISFGKRKDSAIQILRERYARGEISTEQFLDMLSVLEKSKQS